MKPKVVYRKARYELVYRPGGEPFVTGKTVKELQEKFKQKRAAQAKEDASRPESSYFNDSPYR